MKRPEVRTFDVFDTLIARRCVFPLQVFEIVEQRCGVPGFAAARHQAERLIWDRDVYSYDDIYEALPTVLPLAPAQVAALKQLEIEVELEQVIPIAENLAAVQHGDILVSDMYLPAEVIRRLLDKAGLDKEVGLVVTTHGKHHGTVWPELLADYTILEHLGDNQQGDIESPAKHGIAVRRSTTHGLNAVEATLLEAGLANLAMLIREIRLTTWSPDERVRGVQEVQASINFPLMLAASVALGRVVEVAGKKSVLMSSRDCNLWMPLFEEVARQLQLDCRTTYFYTGRLPRVQPSPDYLKYAASLIDDSALVVDLCGSGWSLAVLAEHLGVSNLPVFFVHHGEPLAEYERVRQTPPTCIFVPIVGPQAQGFDNAQLEQANMADYGTALDVRYVAGHPVPVFGPDNRSEYQVQAVRAQQAVFRRGVELLRDYDLREVYQLDDGSLGALVESLYGVLSQQRATRAIFADDFHADEAETLMQLGVSAEKIAPHFREAHLRRTASR